MTKYYELSNEKADLFLDLIESIYRDQIKAKDLVTKGKVISTIDQPSTIASTIDRKPTIENDPVNHPSHYNQGKIEVSDFIADQKLNFDRGNAVKYIVRAGKKEPEKEIQDLRKAIWYLQHEIKILEGKK